jgi:GTPase SAR1 family protein
VDVRAYVTAREVMDEYKLGPNGAIIASVDLMLNFVGSIREEVEESASEGYVIFDTPGQMEIFAFRKTGAEVIKELASERAGIAFIVDAALSKSPSAFISQLFLASSVYYRFKMPQFNIFNKVDLLNEDEREKMVDWVRDPSTLLGDLEKELAGEERMMLKGLLESVQSFLEAFSIYFASCKMHQGLESVYADLQKLYRAGEDFELPEHLRGG